MLGQVHASPLLLTTVCKHLGTEETSCWTSGRGMLSHSCLMEDSSCSAALGLMQWFPGQNRVKCNAAWGPEDHGHTVLIYQLSPLFHRDTEENNSCMQGYFCNLCSSLLRLCLYKVFFLYPIMLLTWCQQMCLLKLVPKQHLQSFLLLHTLYDVNMVIQPC